MHMEISLFFSDFRLNVTTEMHQNESSYEIAKGDTSAIKFLIFNLNDQTLNSYNVILEIKNFYYPFSNIQVVVSSQ